MVKIIHNRGFIHKAAAEYPHAVFYLNNEPNRYTSLSFVEYIPHIGVTCLPNFTFPHFHNPYDYCYLN